MIQSNNIVRLFACVLSSRGYSSGILQDTQRNRFYRVPLSLINIFDNATTPWNTILSTISGKDKDTVNEYMKFLRENELVFDLKPEEIVLYPNISLKWDSPRLIVNSIFEISTQTLRFLRKILFQLDELGCHTIKLVCLTDESSTIEKIINSLNKSSIESATLEVYLKSVSQTTINKFNDLRTQSPIITEVTLYSPDVTTGLQSDCAIIIREGYSSVNYSHIPIFTNNLPFFTESQHHNTCLNRKICIDAEGNIKNCPAMAKSYGNIKDTTMEEAINKPGFKDLWYICKDQIDVCKDCEFRYMCTDCRCFIKDPDNIYSQPAKCTYNPYICLWEGQEGYVPVEECGTYSRETGFVPDKKRIAELNKKIWGEE